MKVAIVHEWLVDWAGAERVLEQIVASFPMADLFALVDHLSGEDRKRIQGKRATTSFLQKLPFAKRKPWIYLPLMPIAIEQLDLSGYDLVISSSHAVAKGVITGPGQIHVSYVHTPMRYAWDLQHQYLSGTFPPGLRRMATRGLLHYLRLWDQRTANGVDSLIANSRFVAKRIFKAYRRNASIIYPPVATDMFSICDTKDDFYVCASRLMFYKRVDIIVDAFTRMNTRKLIVIGDGPEYRSLKQRAGENIVFLGKVSDEQMRDYLQRAKAFIFAALEDFGILPVEAQASGTPVVAYGRGGASETVRGLDAPDPTGVFFEEQTPEAVEAAVVCFEENTHRFSAQACRRNAERFSAARFREQLQQHIEKLVTDEQDISKHQLATI